MKKLLLSVFILSMWQSPSKAALPATITGFQAGYLPSHILFTKLKNSPRLQAAIESKPILSCTIAGISALIAFKIFYTAGKVPFPNHVIQFCIGGIIGYCSGLAQEVYRDEHLRARAILALGQTLGIQSAELQRRRDQEIRRNEEMQHQRQAEEIERTENARSLYTDRFNQKPIAQLSEHEQKAYSNQDKWPICFAPFSEDPGLENGNLPADILHKLFFTQCNHAFHLACVIENLVERTACPICRTEIDIQQSKIFNRSN